MSEPRFLTVQDVLVLHAIAIEDQGGDATVRDFALLDAAVAMPAQMVAGQYLHPDLASKAAAYAFHICRNHPFIDGNKRAAVAAMLAFLNDHGWFMQASAGEALAAVLALADGTLDKSQWTNWVAEHIQPIIPES